MNFSPSVAAREFHPRRVASGQSAGMAERNGPPPPPEQNLSDFKPSQISEARPPQFSIGPKPLMPSRAAPSLSCLVVACSIPNPCHFLLTPEFEDDLNHGPTILFTT